MLLNNWVFPKSSNLKKSHLTDDLKKLEKKKEENFIRDTYVQIFKVISVALFRTIRHGRKKIYKILKAV